MTDELNLDLDLPQEDELTVLKDRAKIMGISFHPNIGVDTLRERIAEKIEGQGVVEEEPAAAPAVALTAKQKEAEQIMAIRKKATALKRVRVTCMNPNKSEWPGEVFTIANAVVPTQKKYVHFNEPWHVPEMVLGMMRERKCQIFHSVVNPDTRKKERKGKLVTEFAIEELPPLTKQEINALAQRQAMANGTSEI